MPKLSKTRSFTVSTETIEVDFKGIKCECANLLKSGIKNQSIVLVAYADKWNEIEVSDLRIDEKTFLENSHLASFENYVQVHNISLSDLGIITETSKKDYSLQHQDFLDLQSEFPEFDYIQISLLNDSNASIHLSQSVYELRQWLNACRRDNISIKQLIENRILEKQKNTMKQEKIVPERNTFDGVLNTPESVTDLEIQDNGQTAIPVEKIEVFEAVIVSNEKFSITSREGEIIDEKSVNNNSNSIEAVPVQTKKPISIQVFETFKPDRISELTGLREKQLEIVKLNPVVKKITDKNSYELAKKTAAALLKASTAIDGKEGVGALGNRCINAFKSMFSSETAAIAKLTRDPYDEQKTINSAWENAELLREQAEQRAKLEKIKKRTDKLFAVPFTFNGSLYSIGTIYCLPSQIETASDEDFNIIVENGKKIKEALDAELNKQNSLAAENEALRKKLAAFESLQNMSNIEPQIVIPTNIVGRDSKHMDVNISNPNSTIKKEQDGINTTTIPKYVLPAQENILLNRLDLENIEHIEKPAYIKCRSYYVRGLKEVGQLLTDIMSNPDVTIKKSVKITELAEILKKSE